MNTTCDKCENMGRYYVTGNGLNSYATYYLCARDAAKLCARLGDTVGRDKFAALISGDGLAV
jgi:hypothetical protein